MGKSLVPVTKPEKIEETVLMAEHRDELQLLYAMLQYRRPHNDPTELRFIGEYLCPLEGIKVDSFNNYTLRIGDAPIVWASHTDSVHTRGGIQKIEKSKFNRFQLRPDEATSNCLGGDDAVGVWLMYNMIKAKVPGLYIFHRGEECGTLGSRHLTKNQPELVKGVNFVVSLDRRADDSIITRQYGGRCCSDEFAESMAKKLNTVKGFKYKIDTGGSITDSAHYTDLVGECTNLSVGYYAQHCKTETVDPIHALKLLSVLKTFDVEGLVCKRKPGEKEPVRTYNYRGHHGHYNDEDYGETWWEGKPYAASTRRFGAEYDADKDWDTAKDPDYVPKVFINGYWRNHDWVGCTVSVWQEKRVQYVLAEEERRKKKIVPRTGPITVFEVVRDSPTAIAAMLDDWGFDGAYLASEVAKYNTDKELRDKIDKALAH